MAVVLLLGGNCREKNHRSRFICASQTPSTILSEHWLWAAEPDWQITDRRPLRSGGFGSLHAVPASGIGRIVKFSSTDRRRDGADFERKRQEIQDELDLSVAAGNVGAGPRVFGFMLARHPENRLCSAVSMQRFHGDVDDLFKDRRFTPQMIKEVIERDIPVRIDALVGLGVSCHDLKSMNLLYMASPDGTRIDRVVLTDFGMSFCLSNPNRKKGEDQFSEAVVRELQRVSMALFLSLTISAGMSQKGRWSRAMRSFDKYSEECAKPCVLIKYIAGILHNLKELKINTKDRLLDALFQVEAGEKSIGHMIGWVGESYHDAQLTAQNSRGRVAQLLDYFAEGQAAYQPQLPVDPPAGSPMEID